MHPLRNNDLVAQLVEHLPFKERVLGSSPSPVTLKTLNESSEFFCTEHFGREVYTERSRSEPQPGHILRTPIQKIGVFLLEKIMGREALH